MRHVLVASLLFATTLPAFAETKVEMEACDATPEVRKELQLTSKQLPAFEKVYAELAPPLKRIQEAMQQREQLRKSGATTDEVGAQTKTIIQLENDCRTRGHELLKPVLSDAQYKLVLEMEELHRSRVSARVAKPPQ